MFKEEEISVMQVAHHTGANVYQTTRNEKGRSVFWVCDEENIRYPITHTAQGFLCPCAKGQERCVHMGAVFLYLFFFSGEERRALLTPKMAEKRVGFSLMR